MAKKSMDCGKDKKKVGSIGKKIDGQRKMEGEGDRKREREEGSRKGGKE